MKRLLVILVIILLTIRPVHALDYTAPRAPEGAGQLMPVKSATFWEDLLYVVKEASDNLKPMFFDALKVCISVFTVVLISSMIHHISDGSKQAVEMVAAVLVGVQLLRPAHTMIDLAKDTIYETVQYGKLLMPVLAGALASQGATASSSAIYTGTAVFTALISELISKLLVPLVYVFLCLCIGNCALADKSLTRIRDFLKWLITWCLKIILYVFLGYMSITGVISGAVDASAMKVAKLTLSGLVPVVGNIISDASETILVSAGIMKNTAGTYGLIALTAILILPFIRIGLQYIFLKITGGISETIGTKTTMQLIGDFSSAMGFMLAMIGITSLMLMISIVCIMKGVS